MIAIQKLYAFNIYKLMSLEISIYLWNHHYNLCHKHIITSKFSPTLFIIIIIILYKNILQKIYHLSNILSIQYSNVN